MDKTLIESASYLNCPLCVPKVYNNSSSVFLFSTYEKDLAPCILKLKVCSLEIRSVKDVFLIKGF